MSPAKLVQASHTQLTEAVHLRVLQVALLLDDGLTGPPRAAGRGQATKPKYPDCDLLNSW